MRNYLVLALEVDSERVPVGPLGERGISVAFCHVSDSLPREITSEALLIALSETAANSTAFQQMVLAALAATPTNTPKWLLKLDRLELPTGLISIAELPELRISAP